MVRMLIRFVRRLFVLALGIFSVWLIVFVFRLVDRRVPSIVAVALSYAAAAYVILPRTVMIGLKILHRRRVPSYTITGDGLPGDPVNLILVGTMEQLRRRVCPDGVVESRSVKSGKRVAHGARLRIQFALSDRAVQRAVSVRTRVRTSVSRSRSATARGNAITSDFGPSDSRAKRPWAAQDFWHSAGRPSPDARVLWIGAGTKDTGFSLTRLTFQITHATDADTNVERDFIIEELAGKKLVDDVKSYRAGQRLPARRSIIT